MSDLTKEELALLADAEKAPTGRRPRRAKADIDASVPTQPVAKPSTEVLDDPTTPPRGPVTPVQYSDDGWGDTPIQMRG